MKLSDIQITVAEDFLIVQKHDNFYSAIFS